MTIQPQNNNVKYLIDPTFLRNAGENNIKNNYRDYFSHYYVPNTRIKEFNVLIDGENFFDLPVKNEEKAYEKIIKMSNNNDYTTGYLLDFDYFKNNYKLIAIDLSKQTKIKDPQQISFIGKLLNTRGATLLSRNQNKLLLIFHKILSQSYK